MVGEGRVEDLEGGQGKVEFGLQGDNVTFVWEDATFLELSAVFDTEFFAVGEAYHFFKFTACEIVTRRDTHGTSENGCSAFLDPIFSMDQERFDQIMGADTFPLEDYFELAFGPGLDPRGGVLFHDGFETGDQSRWAGSAP